MKIGFHTRFTRPLSLGYLSYLACVDSWRKLADRVVVVDGGSEDGSCELLTNWIDRDPKVQLLSNEQTHWGRSFAWEQSAFNIQLGQDALLDCDWILRTDADHVVDLTSAAGLLGELEREYADKLIISFNVYYLWNGKYRQRNRPRDWIVNNRLAKEKGIKVGWGHDLTTQQLTDNPLRVEGEKEFIDPETQVKKTICCGRILPSEGVCSLNVYRYGHFFFSKEQAINN